MPYGRVKSDFSGIMSQKFHIKAKNGKKSEKRKRLSVLSAFVCYDTKGARLQLTRKTVTNKKKEGKNND